MKRLGCRLSPYLRGETKTQESVDLRRCRLVPVLRAETNTLKIVEMRRCRLVPVLRAETNTVKIVEKCLCRLVPLLRAETNTMKIVEKCVSGSWGVPHDSQTVNMFTQRACLQSATFWRPPRIRILLEKFVLYA